MRARLSDGPDPRDENKSGVPAVRGFSAADILKNSSAALLSAKDIDTNTVEIHVYGIRPNTSKDIRANILLDIEPVAGKRSFPMNVTNIQRLSELVGDDLGTVVGRVLELGKVSYEGFDDGLQILAVRDVDEEPAPRNARKKKAEK